MGLFQTSGGMQDRVLLGCQLLIQAKHVQQPDVKALGGPALMPHLTQGGTILPASGVGGNGKRSWGYEWGAVWAECGVGGGPVLVSRMLLLTLPDCTKEATAPPFWAEAACCSFSLLRLVSWRTRL